MNEPARRLFALPARPALGEVLDFLALVWAVDHGLRRASKKMQATVGITGEQRLVLRIIGKFPGIPAGHLARLLHVHPGTLTGMIDRLVRRGLVRRRADPHDGRRSLLGLTEKALPYQSESSGLVEAAVRRVLESAAPEKVRATREVLESILDVLSTRELTREHP